MKTFKLLDVFTEDGFYLTQSYGVNADYYKKFGLLWHEGIDFGHSNKKVIVRSPLNGIIIQDWDVTKDNYGNHCVIWDDEQKCAVWINHLDWNKVSYGDRIKLGQELGEMGATGNATGEHIHVNFVETDDKGNRLYNSKSSNLGLLDPQHPSDPTPPKYPPGVNAYKIDWVKSAAGANSYSDVFINYGFPANMPVSSLEVIFSKYKEWLDKLTNKQLLTLDEFNEKKKELQIKVDMADNARKNISKILFNDEGADFSKIVPEVQKVINDYDEAAEPAKFVKEMFDFENKELGGVYMYPKDIKAAHVAFGALISLWKEAYDKEKATLIDKEKQEIIHKPADKILGFWEWIVEFAKSLKKK